MNPPPDDYEIDEDEVAAIQEAIEDMNAGDQGRPFNEVMAELRAKYGLPSNRKIKGS